MISCPAELARTASVKYFVTEAGLEMYWGYTAGFMLGKKNISEGHRLSQ